MSDRKRVYRISISVLFLVLTIIPFAPAQERSERKISLFTSDNRPAVEMAVRKHEAAVRKRPVSLNPGFILKNRSMFRNGDVLEAKLFDDLSIRAVIDRIDLDVNGVLIVRARVVDDAFGSIIITSDGERVKASISLPGIGKEFSIKYSGARAQHELIEVDPSKRPLFIEREPIVRRESVESAIRKKSAKRTANPSATVTVDVLIIYTPEARIWAEANEGGINNTIALGFATAQLAMDNSNTNCIVRLAHSAEQKYFEFSDYNDYEPRLAYTNETKNLRNQYAADLICFVLFPSHGFSTAFVLKDPAGKESSGLSGVNIRNFTSSSFSWALSKNFGIGDRKDLGESSRLFSYSAGWRWIGNDNNRYCSVSSSQDFWDGNFVNRVPYFSNPDVTHLGAATGHAADGDGARTIREIKGVIADYRTAPSGLSETPTLVAPANNSSGLNLKPKLVWYATGATSYDVYFGTSANPPLVSSGQSEVHYYPGTLANGTTYYWKIVAKNSSGSTTGPVWGFTTRTNNNNALIQKNVWGSWGSGNGQFKHPTDVAVDSNGNIYVVDRLNYRIQKFDSSGSYLLQWGSNGSADGQFNKPRGIAIDSNNTVYVVDSENHRVQKFDTSGNYISKWGSSGSGNGQFSYPYGIAINSQDIVYIADTRNHRVQKFDGNGAYLGQWGENGLSDGQFIFPMGIATDRQGNVWVVSNWKHQIQKFDANGTFIVHILSPGTRWNYQSTADGDYYYPIGVAVNSQGKLYLADTFNHRLQKYGLANASPLDSSYPEVSNAGENYVYNAKWGANSGDGTLGDRPGEFHNPGSVFIDSSNKLYVVDSSNHRIQVFVDPNSPQPPSVDSVTPDSGSGLIQTFTVTCSDLNGASDLRYIYFKVGPNAGSANCAYFRYRRASNKLDLRTDAGSSWKGGYVLGTANVLQNSQVKVNIAQASASAAGNSMTLTLPMQFKLSFVGAQNIYANCLDMAYATPGWQQLGTYTVQDPNVVPVNQSVTPGSGSGFAQTFTAQYSDGNGANDIRYLYFKVSTGTGSANSAYFRYRRASNKLDLRSDSGGSWRGGYVVGSTITLQNLQVRVDISQVSVSKNGNDISLILPLQFKDAFAGAKKIYMNAYDMAYKSPGWQQKGTFTVTSSLSPPENVSVTPNSGSKAWRTFEAVYRDANGADDLMYLYFKVSPDGGSANCAYVRYRVITGKFDLRTNAGGSWIYGPPIGTNSTISNSQVSINVGAVTATKNGSDLTLRMPLVFKTAFAGSHKLYMFCSDKAGLNSGWQQVGTFTVPAPVAPASEGTVLNLDGQEIVRGATVYFEDFSPVGSDTRWHINNEQLAVRQPSYTFVKDGLYDIRMNSRLADHSSLLTGDQLFVGEKLLEAGDLIGWRGDTSMFLLDGKKQPCQELLGDVRHDRILRIGGRFSTGMRFIFNFKSAGTYDFLELRESGSPERWLWVYGHVARGRERIREEKTVAPTDAEQMLKFQLHAQKGSVRIYLNDEVLFTQAFPYENGKGIYLSTPYNRESFDILISK